jgi:hypothetical protein
MGPPQHHQAGGSMPQPAMQHAGTVQH